MVQEIITTQNKEQDHSDNLSTLNQDILDIY